jgi:hypothetical protein
MIEKYLEDLERRIEPDVEEELLLQWRRFVDHEQTTGFFAPRRTKSSPPSLKWPHISANAALESHELMALQQLADCSRALAEGSGAVMMIRPNYGTGLLPSAFGVEPFVLDDSFDTLPTTHPLKGGPDAIRALVEAGVPSVNSGRVGQCFATGDYFVQLRSRYPKVSEYLHIYHPDFQGPMDACELLWGSNLFVDLVEMPDLVKSLLDLITDTYISLMREWNRIVPPGINYTPHWGMMHKGAIMIREDSAAKLSLEMFEEFVVPCDQRLLTEFKGGAIHFCGCGNHFIHRLHEMDGVYSVHVTQPECNDMELIYRNTVDKGIKLIGLPRVIAQEAIEQGRDLRGNVQCW